jgi:hypothetical protein
MRHIPTLIDAANQLGEASTMLARYRVLLVGAGNIEAPAVQHAIGDSRRAAAALEYLAIGLLQATRGHE